MVDAYVVYYVSAVSTDCEELVAIEGGNVARGGLEEGHQHRRSE